MSRLRLVDQLTVTESKVELQVLQLPGLQVDWFQQRNGAEVAIPEWKNQVSIDRSLMTAGSYVVKVQFVSPEIRKTSSRLKDQASFQIP